MSSNNLTEKEKQHKRNKLMKTVLGVVFAILYIGVGLISTLHAIEFFELTNVYWRAVVLAAICEVGQAVALFIMLCSEKFRSKSLGLMAFLTIIQVAGNVYASYKHLVLEQTDNIRYFVEGVCWNSLGADPMMNNIITSWMQGAAWPIIALLFTAMVVAILKAGSFNVIDEDSEDEEYEETNEEPSEEPTEEPANEELNLPVISADAVNIEDNDDSAEAAESVEISKDNSDSDNEENTDAIIKSDVISENNEELTDIKASENIDENIEVPSENVDDSRLDELKDETEVNEEPQIEDVQTAIPEEPKPMPGRYKHKPKMNI